MSFRYPRRSEDLPTKHSDYEEESHSSGHNAASALASMAFSGTADARQSNKENEGVIGHSNNNLLGSSTKSNTAFSSLRFPKRTSELPALESDSEEEDIRNDNLNCAAILNESFILSPMKTEQLSALKDTSCSFLSRFEKIGLDGRDEKKADPQLLPVTSTAKKPPSSSQQQAAGSGGGQAGSQVLCSSLQAIKEDREVAANVHRVQSEPIGLSQAAAQRKMLDTPLRSTEAVPSSAASTTAANNKNNNNNTAVKKLDQEAQFATPQIRSFSIQRRRQRDLCSTQSQKTRSAIANEFRSQKVLFQTPMTVARAPPPNDSIAMALCDTINETGTPSTAENTPHGSGAGAAAPASTKSDGAGAGKSKKSLEGAFNEVEKSKTDRAGEAATASKDSALRINDLDYTIVRKLGCGGSSQVYLAVRMADGKECALKVVDLQGDPAVVEGYLNETKLLAKLQGNVCVVALFDYQLLRKESRLFLVMEKGNSDLHKILQSYTTNLPLYILMNYLYQMLQAVNYIHQNGVIHSDLKPANFLMVSGRLKLIDFGIASNIAIDSTSIIKFSQAGTFNYISPEALTDTSTGSSPMRSNQPKIKISTKSDVWSLGCILYLFLYKKTPFSHIKNIYAKITAISSPQPNVEYPALPPYYPVMLVHMVRSCLQHNPKKRPSCAELLRYPFDMVIPIKNLEVPAAAPPAAGPESQP